MSEENREEVGASEPTGEAAGSRELSKPQSVRSKPKPAPEPDESDEEEDEPAPRKKPKAKRDEEEGEEDERPRNRKGSKRTKGGSGGKIALLIGAFAFLLLVLGVGGYFAFRGPRETASSGNPTDNKVPPDGKGGPNDPSPAPNSRAGNRLFSVPTRKLSKELFAYWPSEQFTAIQLSDYTVPKPPGQPNGSLLHRNSALVELGLKPEQIARALRCSGPGIKEVVFVYEFNTAVSIAEGAKAARWASSTIRGGEVYKHPLRALLVCQAKPNIILFSDLADSAAGAKRLEELLTRTPGESKFPADAWAEMESVSGYDTAFAFLNGEFRIQTTAKPTKFSVAGSFMSTAYNEDVACWEFANTADAEQGKAAYEAFDVVAANMNKNSTGITVKYEIVGTKLYRVYRKQKQ